MRRIGRRSLLGAVSAGVLLAACGPAAPPTATPAPANPAEKPAAAATTAPAAATTAPAAANSASQATAPASQAAAATKPAGAPAASSPAAAAKSGVTLRLHVRTGTEADALAERLPIFTQQNGADVKIESFPGGDYYAKAQTLIAGGQLGDVLWAIVGQGWPIWGATGVLQPLDGFVQSEKFDLSVYYKSALDQFYYQGKLYGLPFKLQPGQIGLFYNADAVKETGVKEPSLDMTFDQLAEISKGLTKTNGNRVERYGFTPYFSAGSDTNGGWWFTAANARAWGAELIDETGTKSLVPDPKFKQSVTWLHDLIFKQKAAPSYKDVASNDPDTMFVSGAGAMFQSGSWTKSVQTRVKDKFTVKDTLMPKGPTGSRGGFTVSDMIAMNAKTQYQPQAWALTKFLTDKEMGVRLGGGSGGASGTCGARPDVFHDDRLMKNPLHPVWIEAAENAQAARYAANFRTQEYNTALWQKMTALWAGDEQPNDQFFSELNTALQQVLDMPKP